MTTRTRVTSKGQVTLPVELRRRLAIEAGDDLVFDETPRASWCTWSIARSSATTSGPSRSRAKSPATPPNVPPRRAG